MKKAIKHLAPGDIFRYAGREFSVLEAMEDGVLVLLNGIWKELPFNSHDNENRNDYRYATLRSDIEDVWMAELLDNGAKPEDFVEFEVDLRPTDQSAGYGSIKAKAAPLTLWQYGRFKDIIPLVEDWWWLVTPLWTRWLRSPDTSNTNYAWGVYSNGGYDYYGCSYSYGVRPALKLNSDLLVSVDGDCDEEEMKVDLSDVPTDALLAEVERRIYGRCEKEANDEQGA